MTATSWFYSLVQTVFGKCWRLFAYLMGSSDQKITSADDAIQNNDDSQPSLFPKVMVENLLRTSSSGPVPCSTDQSFNLVQLTSPADGTLLGWDTIDSRQQQPQQQQQSNQSSTLNFYPEGFFENAINNTSVAAAGISRSDSYSSFASPPELEQDFYTSPTSNAAFFSDSELPIFPYTDLSYPQIHSRGSSSSTSSSGTDSQRPSVVSTTAKESTIWNSLFPFENNQQNLSFMDQTPVPSDTELYHGPLTQPQIIQHQQHPLSPPITESPSSVSSNAPSPKSKVDSNTPFVCPKCHASFRIKGYLTRHMKKHATKKAYNCPFYDPEAKTTCHPSGGFSRRDTYKTHLKARHFLYPLGTRSEHRAKVPGTCAGCDEHFASNEQWVEEHIQKKRCKGFVLRS